ncbi:MAG: hypothetical protein AABW93_03670 [Nanoarchaeota archaeon]
MDIASNVGLIIGSRAHSVQHHTNRMNKFPALTQEEIDAGVEQVEIPLNELETVDVSPQHIERMARGFIMGTQAIGRRKEIREMLEERVTKRIGRKGKYLTDKLFELVDGIYTVQKESGREIRYYKVPPNLAAIVYALDRVLGKPKQFTEHSEEKRGIMVVEHIIRNLAGDNPIAKSVPSVIELPNEKDMREMQEVVGIG